MSRSTSKIIAIILLLWMPLFTGNALAAAVGMRTMHDSCLEAEATQEMTHGDMGEHQHADMQLPLSDDDHGSSCSSCGICHFACAAYLAMPMIDMPAVQVDALSFTAYLITYQSISFAPFTPPPSPRV